MTTLNLNAYNTMTQTISKLSPETFNSDEISLKSVILSLPFICIKDVDDGLFIRQTYKLDTGAHYIEYQYTWDSQDCEDDHSIYVNKAKKFAYGAEKTNRSHSRYVYQDVVRFLAFIKPYLNVSQETIMSNLNLTKTSFSKKDIKANLLALNINEQEVELALNKITKTMIGKAEALPIMVHTCITYYQDETGMDYTPDQLLADLEKRLGKTFTPEIFNIALKDIWGNVSTTLHQYPKGHKLIKDIVIELNRVFTGKSVVGINQVRETVYLASIQAYSNI